MNPASNSPSTAETDTRTPEELPGVVTRLFKGVLYAEGDEKIWQSLLGLSSQVRDYVSVLGLDLILDESEGYAFLKSREDPDSNLPRLIPRRQLTFNVSLLLALLRGRMLEFDTNSSELRLIMTEQDIADMVAVFLPESSNEARIMDRLATDIKKVVELGFLRRTDADSPARTRWPASSRRSWTPSGWRSSTRGWRTTARSLAGQQPVSGTNATAEEDAK